MKDFKDVLGSSDIVCLECVRQMNPWVEMFTA